MRFSRNYLIVVLAVFSCWNNSRATTLARLSLEQLGTVADAVARVRCVSNESQWAFGNIWTVVHFDVLESMKGTLPSRITVRVPGGRVGHILSAIAGTPKFVPGAQAVVFLQRTGAAEFAVAGWIEGTFRVAVDPASGGETVTQDSSAFPVFDPATRRFRTEGIRGMPLNQFRARLLTAISRNGENSR